MDLDKVLSNLPSLSFEDVENYSQECSKQIVFDLLDKGKSLAENEQFFNKCERILAEYRQRLSHRVKSDTGVDLEHKIQAKDQSH